MAFGKCTQINEDTTYCEKYGFGRPRYLYKDGWKYCPRCVKYFFVEIFNCLCCGCSLRIKTHDSKNKRKLNINKKRY